MILAFCLKRCTCPTEALVSWMSKISSSASEMNLVADFQEVTLAVTMERAGGFLLRLWLRGASGAAPEG